MSDNLRELFNQGYNTTEKNIALSIQVSGLNRTIEIALHNTMGIIQTIECSTNKKEVETACGAASAIDEFLLRHGVVKGKVEWDKASI